MLDRKNYFIREHVGFMKLTDTFDILDPQTQAQLGVAKENISGGMKFLRLLVNKRLLPTRVDICEGSDPKDMSRVVLSLSRGFTFLRAKVAVTDGQGRQIGSLQSKAISIGGAFRVFNAQGTEVALVKGDWKGWNFKFTDSVGRPLGQITKKWAGIGKELFTSADNYILAIEGDPDPMTNALLLAAAIAVDTVFKEK